MISIRKIGLFARTYAHLDRYRQIVGVLFKYGFGDLVETLKIEQYLEIGLKLFKKKHQEMDGLSRATRTRMVLEELGPTFVKLGQILSTRPDLIPLEYSEELTRLQDHVAPAPFAEIREIIREESGFYPEDLFAEFDEEPLAAASIGQVYRARLKNSDEEVVVKIQRPGIHKTIGIDLEILLHLANLSEKHLEEMKRLRPTKIVEEFARSLGMEIDYGTEAAHIDRFATQFSGDNTVYVPKIYRELSSARMLTMEFIRGIKPSNVKELRQAGMDTQEVAKRGADLIMKQVFTHGFFHADPHPGNLFILPDHVVCYVDFGMMGRISRQEREDFTQVLMRLVNRDDKKLAPSMLKLTVYDEQPNMQTLERDLQELADRYVYQSLDGLDLGGFLQRIMELAKTHDVSLKPNLFLMLKAFSIVESLGRSLDADFGIIEQAKPFVRSIEFKRLDPRRIIGNLADNGLELTELMQDIPRESRAVLKQLRDGKIKIQFEHHGLAELRASNDRLSNRIAFAIVLASLVIGSSLVVLSGIPPKWGEVPIIGLAGFLVAGFMGFWLLIMILKSGKM